MPPGRLSRHAGWPHVPVLQLTGHGGGGGGGAGGRVAGRRPAPLAGIGNDYYVHLARIGAIYELLEKAPDHPALIMGRNHDCHHDTAL